MSDKLHAQTKNLTLENIAKLNALFPNLITEGKVNLDALKTFVGEDVWTDECYDFTWVGKRAAVAEIGKPCRKTLRPCPEESVNFDTTENLYIEGDNLDVLKLLQESYLGKVKMIYIDPPYNTGHDFVYHDNFRADDDEYNEQVEMFDENGNKNFKENNASNPRFHSDWCSMIYPRLVLARNMLREDGVIFISIDDNEVAQLRKICDEIFGESNFISTINWKGRGGRQDSKYYAAVHEYILCYCRSKDNFVAGTEIKSGDVYPKFDEDKKRFYKVQLLRKWGSTSLRTDRPNLYYPITAPDGTEVFPIISNGNGKVDGRWRHGQKTMQKNIEEGLVEFIKQSNGTWIAYEKIYAPLEGEEKTKKYTTWIDETNDGSEFIKELFNGIVFDYSKSTMLINRFLKMANIDDNDIVLDFFSGSATTAHAVMQMNAEDGGNRKFIMVQIPEVCKEDSVAYKAGYNTICEIGKERIRRAGQKIKEKIETDNAQVKIGEEPKKVPDIGFRVLKLDESNFKDVYFNAVEWANGETADGGQIDFEECEDNIKDDRTALDLLMSCLLEWGVEVNVPIKEEVIEGYKILNYNNGLVYAYFKRNGDDFADEKLCRELAKLSAKADWTAPKVVFNDGAFDGSAKKINLFEIFKLNSPNTTVKVI
jgi:adenine-specific DNA-methyltransferase